ncbi:hypothetical protein Ciccas_005330 [Cichlidogyrus casuarinus]|uniref:Uncharacterized protein n=1 Tax=Cichlidogyrus casuarinus TaxID=1844966 RepID=A0ABD2QCK0_9PLAT
MYLSGRNSGVFQEVNSEFRSPTTRPQPGNKKTVQKYHLLLRTQRLLYQPEALIIYTERTNVPVIEQFKELAAEVPQPMAFQRMVKGALLLTAGQLCWSLLSSEQEEFVETESLSTLEIKVGNYGHLLLTVEALQALAEGALAACNVRSAIMYTLKAMRLMHSFLGSTVLDLDAVVDFTESLRVKQLNVDMWLSLRLLLSRCHADECVGVNIRSANDAAKLAVPEEPDPLKNIDSALSELENAKSSLTFETFARMKKQFLRCCMLIKANASFPLQDEIVLLNEGARVTTDSCELDAYFAIRYVDLTMEGSMRGMADMESCRHCIGVAEDALTRIKHVVSLCLVILQRPSSFSSFPFITKHSAPSIYFRLSPSRECSSKTIGNE